MTIRKIDIKDAEINDYDGIWNILEPVLRAGETYALPRDWSRDEALAYWFDKAHTVFVLEDEGQILGTYYIQANQKGGGSSVCNCGYMVAQNASGKGVANQMCEHSLNFARANGYYAMQFNFVVSANIRAIKLWQRFGFEILTNIPNAFDHPKLGKVDACLMYKVL